MMKTFLILLYVLFPVSSFAESLQYFDKKIDFWSEKESNDLAVVPSALPASNTEKDDKFPWKTYLDPKNEEFFKEGDYTPPKPFMEVARDPSEQNIKNWFEFMQKKNELAKQLEVKMQEYLVKNGSQGASPSIPVDFKTLPKSASLNQSTVRVDPTRFHFRMYFESTCPHCRRMFSVLKRFKDEGFTVEALQVDDGPVSPDEKIVPIGKANLAELKKNGGKAVPFLMIADIKRKGLLPPIEGYHEFDEVFGFLKAASQN